MCFPSGDQARAFVLPGWLKGMKLSYPVFKPQMSTLSLPSAAAIRVPSEDHARVSTLWSFVAKRAGVLWRAGTRAIVPVLAFQTCTELSNVPAEAIYCPRGAQATAVTTP